jgi:hypothetical protein
VTDQPIDRYPTTQTVTCQTCDWHYSQTNGVPATCPNCEHRKRKPALDAVLERESKEKNPSTPPTPLHPFEAWCDTPEGERCQSGQAYGPSLKQRLHLAFEAGRRAS